MKTLNIIAVIVLSSIVLAGCTADKDSDPIKLPSATASPAQTLSEAPRPSSVSATGKSTEQTSDPEGTTPAPTTSAAVPPAIEFAQRWGKRYPNVPEFAILKAANGTCRLIDESGVNWNDNSTTMAAVEVLISGPGIDSSQALEFAQDANQNYCSSVSNHT
jgi:hypothetical protein